MALCTIARPRTQGVAIPDPGGSPSVGHRSRDHATALVNALRVVRLAAGDDPRLLKALDIADRQARALAALAGELHGPA